MVQPHNIRHSLVRNSADLLTSILRWGVRVPVVADVETYGLDPKDGKLLGVALCPVDSVEEPVYVVFQWYDFHTSTWHVSPELKEMAERLSAYLGEANLIGHNYAYDKSWLDHVPGGNTKWKACTRLMWHMASAPSGPRGYGLKDAQVELLGWNERGDAELMEQIAARGGKGKEDIWIADLDVLGKYACLDASSTALVYNQLSSFFDEHDYWWMLEKMVKYSWHLQCNSADGIRTDVEALNAEITALEHTKNAYTAKFFELCQGPISRLERKWREHKAASYSPTKVGQNAKQEYLATWDMQKKFKLSSDPNKQQLFYQELGLPVIVETDRGAPSTAFDSIKVAVRESKRTDLTEVVDALEHFENSSMLLSSYAKPWLEIIKKGRIHPRFNPCGTVSYRLSGYKPYFLNAPFDEAGLMSCFKCDEGWEGVHADFASVEPCVTAHYSQDPSLLKVFRDGLGDVYLDLAQTLFPDDTELQQEYHPTLPMSTAIKERFAKKRKIAKIIQLAVQYTGTEYTVSRNLSEAGMPTSLAEGRALVDAYWKHFHRVAVMNEALHLRFEKKGLLRNVVGRIIRVPSSIKIRKRDGTFWEKPIRYKDLPNRFIQSSAHDLLSFWVLRIAELVQERKLRAKPVILDCHDATSWQAPREEVPALEEVFTEALRDLNEQVRMTVPVRVEMKRFNTLAGLKGAEI